MLARSVSEAIEVSVAIADTCVSSHASQKRKRGDRARSSSLALRGSIRIDQLPGQSVCKP